MAMTQQELLKKFMFVLVIADLNLKLYFFGTNFQITHL